MNIITEKLPRETKNGFKIRADFRNCIKFELLMRDEKLTDNQKIILIIRLFYKDYIEILKDSKLIDKALEDIIVFYSGEREENKKKVGANFNLQKTQSNKKNKKYDFEYDADFIYASFFEQYNIDLNEIEFLHWWKFKALLNGLNEKTIFSKVLYYRNIDLSEIKNKKEKEHYRRLKEFYKLPDMRTEKEKENDFCNALMKL